MTTLTPKQYTTLKACSDHGVPSGDWAGVDELFRLGLIEVYDNDMYGDRSVSYGVSNRGHGAIIVYEDEHATVRFDDLQLLHEVVLRDSGDGSEQLHEVMRRIADLLGIASDNED